VARIRGLQASAVRGVAVSTALGAAAAYARGTSERQQEGERGTGRLGLTCGSRMAVKGEQQGWWYVGWWAERPRGPADGQTGG
jgi:hypothetical protein